MKNIEIRRFKIPAAVIFAALIFVFIQADVFAYEQSYENTDTGYEAIIDDQADLFSESEEEELLEVMKETTLYGNAACATVDENFYSTSYFAGEYYDEVFGASSGTLFLIDMDNRNIYIYSYGRVYSTITDSKADTITDNIYKLASNADYAGCAVKAFTQINTLLSGGKIAQPMKYIGNALMAILIALLINFIIIYTTARARRKTNVVAGAKASVLYTDAPPVFMYQTRTYVPRSSGGDGGGGGGGSSGGGGGGGGGGGHSF